MPRQLNRRSLTRVLAGLPWLALSGMGLCAAPLWAVAAKSQRLTKKIPKTGEQLPVIGMGTWITFNVGQVKSLRDARTAVLAEFFKAGGGMIDSSPMYGSAEEVLGYSLDKLKYPTSLFSATKVWTADASEGPEQIAAAQRLWGLKKFDLYQIHNLLGWQEHLKLLRQRKERGDIRYLGITTSHGRRHDDLIKIMRNEPLDFVQLTYNMVDREVEERLLPLAQEKGIAIIANRPLDGGNLIDRVKRQPYPKKWQEELPCANWAEFLLKFVVSHPAVTCAIPATSKIAHMQENMGAGRGRLPSPSERQRMLKLLASL